MERMKQGAYKNFGIALLVTILSMILAGCCYELYYGINDDMAFRNILSGMLTGKPDAHTYFLSYPLSYVIRTLYTWNASIPWYAVFLAACALLAMFCLLYKGYECLRIKSVTAYVLYSFLVLMLMLKIFLNLQWTLAAVMLSGTAFLLAATYQVSENMWVNVLQIACAAILFVLSYAVRSDCAKMAAPFILLWLFYKPILKDRVWLEWKNILTITGVFLCVILMCKAIDRIDQIKYSTPEWQEYQQYTAARSQVVDYYGVPDYDENREFYEELGISEEAYEILDKDQDFMVLYGINTEHYWKLAEKAKEEYHKKVTCNVMVDTISKYYNTTTGHDYFIVNMVITVVTLLCLTKAAMHKRWLELFYVAAGMLGAMLMWLYLAYKGRMPFRVSYSMKILEIIFLFSCCTLSTEILELREILNKEVKTVLIVTLSLVFVVYGSKELHKNYLTVDKNSALYEWLGYCEKHPDNLYFKDFDSFGSYKEKVFEEEAGKEFNGRLGVGGWVANTPLYKEALLRFNVTNVREAILYNDHVFVVYSKSKKKAAGRLEKYLETYGVDVKRKIVDEIECENGQTFYVYSFSPET